MGASFDDSLLYEVFTAVSDEARAKSRRLDSKGNLTRYQALTVWTPNVNIFRDPRWGRRTGDVWRRSLLKPPFGSCSSQWLGGT